MNLTWKMDNADRKSLEATAFFTRTIMTSEPEADESFKLEKSVFLSSGLRSATKSPNEKSWDHSKPSF